MLVILLCTLGIVGILFLPKNYHIEKEIAVKSPPDKVFVATKEIAKESVSQLDRLSKEFQYQNNSWLNQFAGVDQFLKAGVQYTVKEDSPVNLKIIISAPKVPEVISEYSFEKAGDWTIVKVKQEHSFDGVFGGSKAFVFKNMWEHLLERNLQELKRLGETK